MSRKGDNIRKRKDGRWEGRYPKGINAKGGVLYGSVYGHSYKETKEKLRLAYVENVKPQWKARTRRMQDITFAALLARWQEANSVRLKGGSKTKYARLIESQILPELGQIKLSCIDSAMLNAFLDRKIKNGRLDGKGGLSASYVRSIALILSAAMAYASNEALCQPLKNSVFKPQTPKKELSVLTLEEQKQLEEYLQQRIDPTRVGIFISLYTGLRIGEVCALGWEDVDLDAKTIFVRHTVSRIKTEHDPHCKTRLILDEPKTLSSKRLIPIPSVLSDILSAYKAVAKGGYVISSTDSFISPRTYEARYKRVMQACGLSQIHYHALRHTFATRCIEAGVDVKTLSEILGHAGVAITLNTYVHSSMDLKKRQLEKLVLHVS